MNVSVREVAASAGVSVGTVSNVLNRPERVSDETLRRVNAAILQLGYVRNESARQLRAGQSRSVGLVVRDIRNPFYTAVARGVEDAAAEAGLTVLLANSNESIEREAAYLDLFEQQRVLGILIAPVMEEISRLVHMRGRGTPVVLIDRDDPDRRLSSVAVDDDFGGYLAATHLADLGRQRIFFVGGPTDIRQVSNRLAGARRAAAERQNVSLNLMSTQWMTVLAGRAAGEQVTQLAKSDRPDAIFAANDLLAFGVLQALTMMGDLAVPNDIALMGYDDIDFAASAVVPLSTVKQPSELLGRTAMEMLVRETQSGGSFTPEGFFFQPELVVRASTSG